jgi:UvrD/REP helicase N-terminal domain
VDGIVFTPNSLGVLAYEAYESPVIGPLIEGQEPGNQEIAVVTVGSKAYVFEESDTSEERRIFLAVQRDGGPWAKEARQTERQILERMLLFAKRAERTPIELSHHWGQYKYDNLVGFYACGRGLASSHLRWIAEVQQAPPHDICFWLLTASTSQPRLENYTVPEAQYAEIRSNWQVAYDQSRTLFTNRTPTEVSSAGDIDLLPLGFSDVTQNRSREQWHDSLTPQQKAFINQKVEHAVKLRGPAGSGKTLTMALKALHEIDQAHLRNESPRMLFVTHSWALAEEVDSNIGLLSEWGQPDELTILPLLTVAQEIMPAGLRAPGRSLVGEDSVSSKMAELNRIESILDELVRGDWLTFKDEVSDELRARIESRDRADKAALAWDCLIEFGCVLGADGIFPGIGAEARYMRLPRTSWMMPLPTDSDKQLIFHLYTNYMRRLDSSGEQTSDQLVNDFLKYLDTFAWLDRRVADGYDYIFVDEFHLFNAQERHMLHYLTRSRFEYPKILMALDPKQSPWGIYTGLADASPTSTSGKMDDEQFGAVSAVDLATVHRFSPQILALVKHLDLTFPALDLGPDWRVGMDDTVSAAADGPVPVLVHCGSQQDEVIELNETIRTAKASGRIGNQIAIAIIDKQKFPVYQDMTSGLSKAAGMKMSVIADRDDIELVQYRRRGLIMAPAEYLAGLQFDSVFIAGLPPVASVGVRLTTFLSLLYVALTRARRDVTIFVNDDYGGVPAVLDSAVGNGQLNLRAGKRTT